MVSSLSVHAYALVLAALCSLCSGLSLVANPTEAWQANLKQRKNTTQSEQVAEQCKAVNDSAKDIAHGISDFNATVYQMQLKFNETTMLVDKLLGMVNKAIGALEITNGFPGRAAEAKEKLVIANTTLEKVNDSENEAWLNFSGSLGQMTDEVIGDAVFITGVVAVEYAKMFPDPEDLKQFHSTKQAPETVPENITATCEALQPPIEEAGQRAPGLVLKSQSLKKLLALYSANSSLSRVNASIADIAAVDGMPESITGPLMDALEAISAVQMAFTLQADEATAEVVPQMNNATAAIGKLPAIIDLAQKDLAAYCALAKISGA